MLHALNTKIVNYSMKKLNSVILCIHHGLLKSRYTRTSASEDNQEYCMEIKDIPTRNKNNNRRTENVRGSMFCSPIMYHEYYVI